MERFIDKLRIYRNLILHRSTPLNKKHNQRLLSYLENVKQIDIERIFTKSKDCIEIMNYIMELN